MYYLSCTFCYLNFHWSFTWIWRIKIVNPFFIINSFLNVLNTLVLWKLSSKYSMRVLYRHDQNGLIYGSKGSGLGFESNRQEDEKYSRSDPLEKLDPIIKKKKQVQLPILEKIWSGSNPRENKIRILPSRKKAPNSTLKKIGSGSSAQENRIRILSSRK